MTKLNKLMYDIEIDYTTGNSFNSERCKELMCNPVTDFEMAKLNLKKIKEHYNTCKEHPNCGKKFELTLQNDNGDITIRPFWIGYFESLHSAKIVLWTGKEIDTDTSFFINYWN